MRISYFIVYFNLKLLYNYHLLLTNGLKMTTILPKKYKSFTDFEIINVRKLMEAKASLELPTMLVTQNDGEESRKIDLLAHLFFPKEPSLTFAAKIERVCEPKDETSLIKEFPAPSKGPSILSRLVITNADSTHLISFMLPSQSDILTFQPSVSDNESAQVMQDIPLTLRAKSRKPILQEATYVHLPSISELCEELSPDETALACDPIGYSSPPRSTPDRQPFLKPAGRLVREQTFIDLEDALDENPEGEELACDPEDYVSPSTPAMQPIKPAGKLVRQQAFVDLSDALQEDSSKADLKNSSDNKDVPSELILRMSDDGERQVRTISPYPLQKP